MSEDGGSSGGGFDLTDEQIQAKELAAARERQRWNSLTYDQKYAEVYARAMAIPDSQFTGGGRAAWIARQMEGERYTGSGTVVTLASGRQAIQGPDGQLYAMDGITRVDNLGNALVNPTTYGTRYVPGAEGEGLPDPSGDQLAALNEAEYREKVANEQRMRAANWYVASEETRSDGALVVTYQKQTDGVVYEQQAVYPNLGGMGRQALGSLGYGSVGMPRRHQFILSPLAKSSQESAMLSGLQTWWQNTWQEAQSDPLKLAALGLSAGSKTMNQLLSLLATPGGADEAAKFVSQQTGFQVSGPMMRQLVQKLAATGSSGLVYAITGNFPIAAAAYFGLDRTLSSEGKQLFDGFNTGEVLLDGTPVIPMGVEVPEGLPNEIFEEFRFCCYDRLTGKWWPTDEVKVLEYQGDDYRWLCLDRVTGKVFHANLIKKPRIYLD